MTTKMFCLLGLCSALLLLCSCASIVSKSVYPVSLCSSPTGLKYELRDKNGVAVSTGRTPAMVTLHASNGFFSPARYQLFCFSEDGKSFSQVPVSASLDGWYVGNILFGGLIGWLIVDPATGAMWKLPDMAYANLPVEAAGLPQPQPPAAVPAAVQ